MKIGFVINQLALGGAERQAVGVAVGLVERGHECTFFTFYGKTYLREELEPAGVEVVELRAGRSYWRGVLPLLRELRRRRIDVVNTHTPLAGSFGHIAAFLAHVPVVSTEQYRGDAFPMKIRILNDLTLNLARTIICISQEVRRVLHRRTNWYLLRRDNAVVIYNAVNLSPNGRITTARDSDPIAKRAELGLLPGDFVICNVGRYESQKGLEYLLEALARLDAEKLVLVGWGSKEQKLRSLAQELGVAERVVFAVERLDALEIVRASDAFAFPSLTEGLGVALLEAMALERPVVASGIPPLTEVVRHEVDGLLVPPRDPNAIAEAVRRLRADSELSARLVASARLRIEAEFELERSVAAYEKVLAAAAGVADPGRPAEASARHAA